MSMSTPNPMPGGSAIALPVYLYKQAKIDLTYTVELQWLEHLWDHENMFETGVVPANECYS